MARQVVETLVDDLDSTPATETVQFGLDGRHYEIDLNARNAAALRKALERYVAVARRQAGRAVAARTRSSAAAREYDIARLREWAGKRKIELSARGRIPYAIVEQYKAEGGR